MTKFDAILPAGGRIGPALAEKAGCDVKALIKFNGVSMLRSTIDALRASDLISRIVVVGGREVQEEASSLVEDVLPEGASGPENILSGLKDLLGKANPPDKVFVVTTDLPFLTAQVIKRYIHLCPADRDICVPLINRQEWDLRFPGCAATFAKLQDGSWTTGCAYLIDVGALQSSMPQIERVFQNRKSIYGMAKLLGPQFLFKFLCKTLNVPDVETKIETMLGCSGAAIRNAPTELAFDIDDVDDYVYALQIGANG